MSPRCQEWLCRRPALVVTTCSFLLLCIAAGVSELDAYLVNQHVFRQMMVVGHVVIVLAVLGIAGSTFKVGIAMGRSGLPVSGALKGLKYAPLAVVLFFAVFLTTDFIREGWSSAFGDPIGAGEGAAVLYLGLIVLQLIGWGLAALVVRRQLRLGKWEINTVVEATVAKPPLLQWIATHPVWTMNLLAAGTATVTVVTMAILQQLAEQAKGPSDPWKNGPLVLLVWGLLAALYAVVVGVILARHGESTQRALLSAFWFPVTFGLPLLLLCACEYGIGKHQEDYEATVMMWMGLLVWYFGVGYYIAGQFLGWLVSAIYACFVQRRRAKNMQPVAS